MSAWVGSSPLARGTFCKGIKNRARQRLIPARAGNMPCMRSSSRTSSAHPRSRGEHPQLSPSPLALAGSSPLARGTSVRGGRSALGGRLIPARAGNITVRAIGYSPSSAHPRSRGEHLVDSGKALIGGGSSPLARGTF